MQRGQQNTHGVDKSAESCIINNSKDEKAGIDVHFVGKINREIFSCVTNDITTDEVIITDERIQHIKDHHPNNYETVMPYLAEALSQPDYIPEDKNNNTGLVLKMIDVDNQRIQIVLRLHTSKDPSGYKNSIISSWAISEERWNNYVKNKKTLYKRE